ncbi:hypothetical protein GGS24DRAFT_498527 [Hypoxylon argillaceum]|nr:hypothetical protein GGS24DRAFT_498527 [Hypoxylon argillaceum]KAI1148965.1 hypothetical protein F4825DRAFT_453953 [Nemania diffusa]
MGVTDSPSPESLWPGKCTYMTPSYLASLRRGLSRLERRYDSFQDPSDPSVEHDLEYLIVWICAPAYSALRVIASEAPPIVPVDPILADLTATIATEGEATTGNQNPRKAVSQIYALPNPSWDAVFQEYGRWLELGVDTFIVGDSPSFQVDLAKADAPYPAFSFLRQIPIWLSVYPHLRSFAARLKDRLDGSRSGACYTQHWMRQTSELSAPEELTTEMASPEISPNPAVKRKTDTPDLGLPTKRRLLDAIKEEGWSTSGNPLSA